MPKTFWATFDTVDEAQRYGQQVAGPNLELRQGWNRLRARMGAQFHAVVDAVAQAMAQTPRSSALVEHLNSKLRTYFTLRRQFGGAYLDLLLFFLNHRCFLRSRVPQRVGKSPAQLMTGQDHPHWLTLLGLGPLQLQLA